MQCFSYLIFFGSEYLSERKSFANALAAFFQKYISLKKLYIIQNLQQIKLSIIMPLSLGSKVCYIF